MLSAWSLVAGVVLVSALVLGVLARRAPREVEPTIRAFSELRAALRPAVAELRMETDGARARLAALRGQGTDDTRR